MSVQQRRFIRVQERGQFTVPADLRRRLGWRKGDLLAIRETAEGVLISRQPSVPAELLDRAGQTVAEQGVSVADLRSWAEAGLSPEGSALRDYTPEEIQQFLTDDMLTEEQKAIAARFPSAGTNVDR